ncbi:MAG: sigma-70 family RNA polymerase sigma factor [Mycobacteriales bacterium]
MSADRQRLEHLATTHGPRLLAYLARRTSIVADAADVFQEVLVVTWRRLDRVPVHDDAAIAWMFATARRCLANHQRGQTRRMAATGRLCQHLLTSRGTASDGDGRVQAALERLNEGDRELLRLVYWERLTTEQAATVLNVRPAAARKRLERARQKVRDQLGELDDRSLTRISRA